MQIVTDAGCDLAPEQLAEFGVEIHQVPLTIPPRRQDLSQRR